ncbi:predicted protein [Sclerotinia sclerotiorum 1980 UF-70]|uniref:Uncharacterized protein n=1 Tax=Sclerotinia sclerotiorum (strain ATCC 18683 / 1980 / Ss-1) TaxID=665079 RepID=A7EBR9_SCLS1|nr:predicted protein [Sclerotinia sclerotiorum 1980 UF-70]EDN99897.1 predicted protein [Sclerotinia sclerotiorum 1980 UF-70]
MPTKVTVNPNHSNTFFLLQGMQSTETERGKVGYDDNDVGLERGVYAVDGFVRVGIMEWIGDLGLMIEWIDIVL